jgi:hypothetical protein
MRQRGGTPAPPVGPRQFQSPRFDDLLATGRQVEFRRQIRNVSWLSDDATSADASSGKTVALGRFPVRRPLAYCAPNCRRNPKPSPAAAFGPEASLFVMLIGLAIGFVFIVVAMRWDRIRRPVWARPREAPSCRKQSGEIRCVGSP